MYLMIYQAQIYTMGKYSSHISGFKLKVLEYAKKQGNHDFG